MPRSCASGALALTALLAARREVGLGVQPALVGRVGGNLDELSGKRVTFAFFPWNWDRGDGCIIRLVAMMDKGQHYRIEAGENF